MKPLARHHRAVELGGVEGAVYRHTTTAMEARVVQALDNRVAEVLAVSPSRR